MHPFLFSFPNYYILYKLIWSDWGSDQDLSIICNSTNEGGWFKSGTKWKIGYGSKVNFWEDGWKEDGVPLLEKYPRMYHIS